MKKLRYLIIGLSIVLLLLAVSCTSSKKDLMVSVNSKGETVVERFGQLSVDGINLVNEDGQKVQLRGMSSHGIQWYGKYINKDVMQWVRDDWNAQIFRLALYLREGGYMIQPSQKSVVLRGVDAAIELGMYVIIDWHVHLDRDPMLYKDDSVAFFSEMAELYGEYPNVIYEICNEPNGDDVTWEENIRPYAMEVIQAIREKDPDNIIIVGTPHWSQYPDEALSNPITEYENIMYTFHFYAGTHGDELREKVVRAQDGGLPIFVTEWGTSEASGDGGPYTEEAKVWLKFLEDRGISWVNWSITNKGETSGILKMNRDRQAEGGWAESDLNPSGVFMRKVLRNEEKLK